MRKSIAFLAGILFFTAILLLKPFGIDADAARVLAVAALMITWWVGEALPLPVVALLPLVLFPVLGIASLEASAAPYANPVIFLFMGGFMIGLAIEKWNLHQRIALNIIRLTGTSGNRIILGFIVATGLLSMWLSNTATTMMMFPIALSVIKVMEENSKGNGSIRNLSICILLSIAYAANLGGIATIIGTPPNVAYVAFLEKHNNYTFQFADWMTLCLPLSVVLLCFLYIVLIRLYPSRLQSNEATRQLIKSELGQIGKMTVAVRRVLLVFCLTAFLWITKDLLNTVQSSFKLNDTIIAVFGALLLFVLPSGVNGKKPANETLLQWNDTDKMAWGILLLFGGGISLATQLENAGLIQMLGSWVAGYAQGGFLLVLIITVLSIFISEVMSNVAQVIVFAPVVAGISEALGLDPLQLGVAMTLGASCAGMLPMGTPPNAIVFGSGKLKLRHMMLTGFIVNIISALLISAFCWYLLPVFVKQ